MDIDYIKSLIIDINKQRENGESYITKMINTIPEGGEDSFSSKVGPTGIIQTSKPESLFARSLAITAYMEQLVDKKVRMPLILYRGTELLSTHLGHIVQPVPFSATWNRDFAIEWINKKACCVFEITVGFNTFLPLSIPEEIHDAILKRKCVNQSQQEVFLPACRLIKTGEYIIEKNGTRTRIIQCTAKKLAKNQLSRYYPENIKKQIKAISKRKDLQGWINEKLFEYYGW